MKRPQESTRVTTDQSTIKVEDLPHHTEENAIVPEVVAEDPPEIEDILEVTTEIVAIQESADQETGAREDIEEETTDQGLEIAIDLTPETEEDKFIKPNLLYFRTFLFSFQ